MSQKVFHIPAGKIMCKPAGSCGNIHTSDPQSVATNRRRYIYNRGGSAWKAGVTYSTVLQAYGNALVRGGQRG